MLHLRKLSIFAAFFIAIIATAQAQVNKISLGQTPGEFTIKSLTLTPGQYQFEILNNGVDHEIGFVLAPKGKTEPEHHIKEAYVTAPVKNGKSSTSKVVLLEAGEYVYFCPLNPTEQYNLTVEASVKKIALEQVKGAFTQTSLTLEAGKYQFAISNNGVDHELGFVLAPKGKTEQKYHIKEAYVTKPVKEGMTSMTKVVDLKAGEYVYFCPLNPTKEYSLTVK
jgi:plastocyanin